MTSKFPQHNVQSALMAMLILIFSPNHITTKNRSNISYWTTCEGRDSLVCRCNRVAFMDVTARCHFNHVHDLCRILQLPHNIFRLNLSGNNIKYISGFSFENYTQLTYLSLSSNKIRSISQRAFSGLRRLRELNLQNNPIKHWDTTSIREDLPNLLALNIAQSIYWKPDQQILSLPNLRIVYLLLLQRPGSYWCPFKCYLGKAQSEKAQGNNTIFVEKFPSSLKETLPNALLSNTDGCWHEVLFFRDDSYWNFIGELGYYFHCTRFQPSSSLINTIPNCHYSHTTQQNSWYYTMLVETPYCYQLIQNIHIITLIAGICSMLFNLTVITTTIRSRILRESVAHVLVANIAVADLLISFYMIIFISARQIMPIIDFHYFHSSPYCRIIGALFLVGQFSSAEMSFITTLERYLAVVYCMRPHIRITMRMCFVAMATVWGTSVSLAVSFVTSPKFSKAPDTMCVPKENIDEIYVLYYMAGIGVVLYMLSIALYVAMYRDFQKTNHKTVQLQRENRMARRIALIMFTNVLFFIFPLICIFIVQRRFKGSKIALYIFSKTSGILCLAINACFNPILFSFRNQLFRSEVTKNFPFFRNSVAPHS